MPALQLKELVKFDLKMYGATAAAGLALLGMPPGAAAHTNTQRIARCFPPIFYVNIKPWLRAQPALLEYLVQELVFSEEEVQRRVALRWAGAVKLVGPGGASG